MASIADRHSRLPHLARQVAAAQTSGAGLDGYVREAVRRGYSGRRALEELRRAGGRVRTQTFHELYRSAGGV